MQHHLPCPLNDTRVCEVISIFDAEYYFSIFEKRNEVTFSIPLAYLEPY